MLADQESFQPRAAFLRLDRDRKGLVSAADIRHFLSQNEILIKDDLEAGLFLKHYDLDRDQFLDFGDFSSAILPKTDAFARQRARDRKV